MNSKQKKLLTRIVLAIIIFAVAMFAEKSVEKYIQYVSDALICVAYITAGWDVVYKGLKNIGRKQFLDENFLMTLATAGAFYIGEASEGVMVMVLYQIGELFQQYAVGRSRNSISELMSMVPEYANLVEDGVDHKVDPEDVEINQIILVKPGEKIPLDGIVVKGKSFIDTAALTGEAVPIAVETGSEVLSGSVNQNGVLYIKVTKIYDDSTVARILELVENAGDRKAKAENFITKFARYYTPAVVIAALILAVIPPLAGSTLGYEEWIRRACMFLVISCPCALVISVPLSFFGGIGAAAKAGILVKGSNYIETLAKTETVVMDKTGTLTKGTFSVKEVITYNGYSKEVVLDIAAAAEKYSLHPIAESLRKAGNEIEKNNMKVENITEISGKGIRTNINGETYFIGSRSFEKDSLCNYPEIDGTGTVVYVAKKGELLGYIRIDDEIKTEAADAIRLMKEKCGIRSTVMLTGDRKDTGEKVGKKLGIDRVFAQLLPEDKVDVLEKIISEKRKKSTVAYIGDGINDAPVLTRADVGIAMGALGSDAAIEAADVVIMDDSLMKISDGIRIARKTIGIVKQNIAFALGVKFIFLILSAFGAANLWEAVFADVGVAFIAILNAMRTLISNR